MSLLDMVLPPPPEPDAAGSPAERPAPSSPVAPALGRLPAAVHWACVHTKARAEKVVAEWLEARRVPHYLPLARHRRFYGVRVRESWLPLFSGYVFFDAVAIDRRRVFDSRKVANVLVPKSPDALRADLENLARALAVEPAAKSRPLTEEGTPVEVFCGPLAGTRGRLVRPASGAALVIAVSFIGFGAEITIDEAYVRAA